VTHIFLQLRFEQTVEQYPLVISKFAMENCPLKLLISHISSISPEGTNTLQKVRSSDVWGMPCHKHFIWQNLIWLTVSTSSPQPGRCSTLTIVMIMIIIIIITQKFATPYEQYFGWGNNINFIVMRDQNSPRPMNNILFAVITSTLSP